VTISFDYPHGVENTCDGEEENVRISLTYSLYLFFGSFVPEYCTLVQSILPRNPLFLCLSMRARVVGKVSLRSFLLDLVVCGSVIDSLGNL